MNTQLITGLLFAVALIVGGFIGFLFGTVQNAALLRNRKREEGGTLKNGWMVMPGSMGRIAILLILLAAIQIVCPMLFEGSTQWLVSLGVILGYGWTLFKHIRHHSLYHA